eukprot:945185-Prorocentrum_lima.AAC.1
MTSSLVGSEMCIRDSPLAVAKTVCFLSLNMVAPGTLLDNQANCWTWTVSYTHLTLPTICSV